VIFDFKKRVIVSNFPRSECVVLFQLYTVATRHMGWGVYISFWLRRMIMNPQTVIHQAQMADRNSEYKSAIHNGVEVE